MSHPIQHVPLQCCLIIHAGNREYLDRKPRQGCERGKGTGRFGNRDKLSKPSFDLKAGREGDAVIVKVSKPEQCYLKSKEEEMGTKHPETG